MGDFILLTKVTWRNLFRNFRRTGITVASIMSYTATIIFFVGIIDGFSKSTYHNITHTLVGDVQLHAPGFRDSRSMYKAIREPEKLMEQIRKLNRTEIKVVARGLGIGLVSVGSKSAGGSFSGVTPKDEKLAFDLHTKMAKGSFLSEQAQQEIVLGSRVAKSLNAKIGDELVAVVQAADGSMGNELFTIKGILLAVGESVDRNGLFIHRSDYDSLFMAAGRVHQMAFNGFNSIEPKELVATFEPFYKEGDWKSWRELMPALAKNLEMNDASFWILGFIFAIAAALGTMNTMLMATHDRVREFGVIRALGASPWRIIRDIGYEAMLMGLIATSLGGLLGAAVTYYFQIEGMDLSSFTSGNLEMAGIMVDSLWRADLSLKSIVFSMLLIFVITVLSSLYPAVKSARLQPVTAMKHV